MLVSYDKFLIKIRQFKDIRDVVFRYHEGSDCKLKLVFVFNKWQSSGKFVVSFSVCI